LGVESVLYASSFLPVDSFFFLQNERLMNIIALDFHSDKLVLL